MSIVHSYYSWIPGGQSVAEQIDAIDGVSYVESGPFGSSAIPFSKISAPALQGKCICIILNHQRKYQKLKIYPESGPRGLGLLERLTAKLKDIVPSSAPNNGASPTISGASRVTRRTEPTTPSEDTMAAPPIPNIFRGTSHEVIKGGHEFLKFLSDQSEQLGIAKITVDTINNRAHYTGEAAEFEAAGHSVLAYYSNEGRRQKFRVFPKKEITVERLQRRLRKAWEEKHQRGGVGQSSKDEISIPPRIRQQQHQEVSRVAETIAAETPGRDDRRQLDSVELTTQQAETYTFLLGLNPDGQTAKDFSLERVTALLTKQYKTKNQGTNRYMALIGKGLIKPGEIVSGRAHVKTSLILHRRYRVVDRRNLTPTAEPARPVSPAPTPLAEPAVSPPKPQAGGTVTRTPAGRKTGPVFEETLDGHLAFFERCAALEAELKKLTAERHRRERELRKQGLTVEFVHGQAALLRIKR